MNEWNEARILILFQRKKTTTNHALHGMLKHRISLTLYAHFLVQFVVLKPNMKVLTTLGNFSLILSHFSPPSYAVNHSTMVLIWNSKCLLWIFNSLSVMHIQQIVRSTQGLLDRWRRVRIVSSLMESDENCSTEHGWGSSLPFKNSEYFLPTAKH